MNKPIDNSKSGENKVDTKKDLKALTENINANSLKRLDVKVLGSYMILIVSILVITLSLVVLTIPQYRKYKNLKSSIVKKQEELKVAKAESDYLHNLQSLSTQLENNIKLARQALPLSNEVPDLLNTLLQIAQNTNVEVKSLSLSGITEPHGKNKVGEIKVSMSIQGNYDDVLQFLQSIENSRRLLTVETISVSLTSEDEVKKNQVYTVALGLNGYYMPEVNTKSLSIDTLSKRRPVEGVITKLSKMDTYDAKEVLFEIGNENPFLEEEDVKIGVDVITGKKVETEPAGITGSNGAPDTSGVSDQSLK